LDRLFIAGRFFARAFRARAATVTLALHGLGRSTRITPEQISGRLIGRDSFRHGIGLLFVLITWPPHSFIQLDAASLVDQVSRFMGGEPHVWRRTEADAISDRIAGRSHSLVGSGRGAADLRLRSSNVMRSE
jgi:hypothetical protein